MKNSYLISRIREGIFRDISEMETPKFQQTLGEIDLRLEQHEEL